MNQDRQRHPAVTAWEEWIDSEEGQSCRVAATLHASSTMDPYLRNRLQSAFLAGFKAGQRSGEPAS